MATVSDAGRRFELEVAYEDCEKLINKLVWDHVSRFGGEYDDLRQEACLWFLEAYRQYDEGKRADSTLTGWVGFVVRHELLELRRRAATARLRRVAFDPDRLPARPAGSLLDLLASLGEDARLVAKLVLEPPDDLRLTLLCRHGNTRRVCREALQDYLEMLGWDAGRAEAAFAELDEEV